jgi:hypothetical protein
MTANENAASGTLVGSVRVGREDCNDTYSYTLAAHVPSMFEVSVVGGFPWRAAEIRVLLAANFEVQSVYTVTVLVWDTTTITPGTPFSEAFNLRVCIRCLVCSPACFGGRNLGSVTLARPPSNP